MNRKQIVVIMYKEQKLLRTCDFNSNISRGMVDIGTVQVSQPRVSSLPFYSIEHTVKGKQDLLRDITETCHYTEKPSLC